MDVLTTIETLRHTRATLENLGFVPTMGYLHEGHLSLVRQAKAECQTVAVSIFVNPTQFAPHEDLESYPRDLERDLSLLQQVGVDVVFVPNVAEIYPDDFTTFVNVQGVTEMLEGTSRPLFFRGVATVVCKLLHIIRPERAYFGQKDAQQCVVVRKMVRDLNIPVEIIIGPTIREPDGLAMSSRNAYLDPYERQAATVLYRALCAARELYESGVHNPTQLRQTMHHILAAEPLAQIDYISAAHPDTLQELESIDNHGILLSMAVRIGKTRLIDNVLLPANAF